jgi:hypothetical protein
MFSKANGGADMETSSPQSQVLENAFYKRLEPIVSSYL